jgi:hypothetical protein
MAEMGATDAGGHGGRETEGTPPDDWPEPTMLNTPRPSVSYSDPVTWAGPPLTGHTCGPGATDEGGDLGPLDLGRIPAGRGRSEGRGPAAGWAQGSQHQLRWRRAGTRRAGSAERVSPVGDASARSKSANASITSVASQARLRRPTVTCLRILA